MKNNNPSQEGTLSMHVCHSHRKSLLAGLLLTAAVALNGCVYMIVGGIGAVGGYVISPDTVEGIITGHDQGEVWTAAVEVASIMGLILEREEAGGILICKINGGRVTITVGEVSGTAVRLTVKARKAFLPRIRTAQDIYIKIEAYLGNE